MSVGDRSDVEVKPMREEVKYKSIWCRVMMKPVYFINTTILFFN